MAKLAGGVAVIKVGAATEGPKEKKARADDALHATAQPWKKAWPVVV